LDVMMPGMSGYRVCQSMRAEEIWTPVLFLTAKDGEWDEVEGFETGADDWLTKPFSYPVLVARLRSLVRRGATARPATFSAGDLVLDPAARTVHRGDTEIELTAREFAVLEFLMRHPAEVVTKLEVLDNVWDDAFDGDPNIVEVYIGRLRRKVDRPFGRDGIQTLRGAGYRMAADGG
ncbi:MAG TPA: DNA-binding response regulator, partial [Microbacterium sp.]|nr:DNA-binding response regulator [Microbacterium sp.]